MTDQDFLTSAQATMAAIEQAMDELDIDVDALRSGNVLSIELENGSKIIVNIQEPAKEIWLAAKSGGYHFRQSPAGDVHPLTRWIDTRSKETLKASLERTLSEQSGERIHL